MKGSSGLKRCRSNDSSDTLQTSRPSKKMKPCQDDERMAKNRASAHKSRIKKQHERSTLEVQVRMLSAKNHTLSQTLGNFAAQLHNQRQLREQNVNLMKELFEMKLLNQKLQGMVNTQHNQQSPKISITNVTTSQTNNSTSQTVFTGESRHDSAVVISPQWKNGTPTATVDAMLKLVIWCMLATNPCKSIPTNSRPSTRTSSKCPRASKPSSKTSKSEIRFPFTTNSAQRCQFHLSRSTTSRLRLTPESRQDHLDWRYLQKLSHAEAQQLHLAGQLLHILFYIMYRKLYQDRPSRPRCKSF